MFQISPAPRHSSFFQENASFPDREQPSSLRPDSLPFVIKELPKDQWMSKFAEKGMIDKKWFLLEALVKEKLPILGKEELVVLVKWLVQPFFIKAKNNEFQVVQTSLAELLIHLKNKFSSIENIELVGGAVLWLLKTYLLKVLTQLGIDDPENWLTQDLKEEIPIPSDYDLRLNAPFGRVEELEEFKEEMVKIVAEKTGISNEKYIRDVGFLKFNSCYGANEFATVSIGDPETFPADFLFVRKLNHLSLFVQDSLRIMIDPLLEGLQRYGEERLLKFIEKEQFFPKIVPESDFKNGWQAIIDRVGGIYRSVNTQAFDNRTWVRLASAFTKGKRVSQEYLEEEVIEKLFQEVEEHKLGARISRNLRRLLATYESSDKPYSRVSIFALYWIGNFLRDHHRQNPYALTALKFHTSHFLAKRAKMTGGSHKRYISEIWKGITPTFSTAYPFNSSSILWNFELVMQRDPSLFKLLTALLQAKAFFCLNRVENSREESFRASLISHHGKPAIQIFVDDCYLLMPFDPVRSFQIILSHYSHLEESTKTLLDEFIKLLNFNLAFKRGASTQLARHLSNLKLSLPSLEVVGEELFESSDWFLNKLGYVLLLLGNNFTQNRHTFPFIIRRFLEYVAKLPLEEDLVSQSTLARDFAVSVLDSTLFTRFVTSLKTNPERAKVPIHWANSLAGLTHKTSQQAYKIWSECPNDQVKRYSLREFLIRLSSKEPDLAFEVINSLSPEEYDPASILQLFMGVWTSIKSLSQTSLKNLSSVSDRIMELAVLAENKLEELPTALEWLSEQLFKQNENEKGIQVLKFSLKSTFRLAHKKESLSQSLRICQKLFGHLHYREIYDLWQEGKKFHIWDGNSQAYREMLFSLIKNIYALKDPTNLGICDAWLLELCSNRERKNQAQLQPWIANYLERVIQQDWEQGAVELARLGQFVKEEQVLSLKLALLERQIEHGNVSEAGESLIRILSQEDELGGYPIQAFIQRAIKALIEKKHLEVAFELFYHKKALALFCEDIPKKVELASLLLKETSKKKNPQLRLKGWNLLVELLASQDLRKGLNRDQVDCCLQGLKCLPKCNKMSILEAWSHFKLLFSMFNKAEFCQEAFQAYRQFFCKSATCLLREGSTLNEEQRLVEFRKGLSPILENPLSISKKFKKAKRGLESLQSETRVACDLALVKILVSSQSINHVTYGCSLLEALLKKTKAVHQLTGLESILGKLTENLLKFSFSNKDPLLKSVKSIFQLARAHVTKKSEFIPLISNLKNSPSSTLVKEACRFVVDIINQKHCLDNKSFLSEIESLFELIIEKHFFRVSRLFCACLCSVNFSEYLNPDSFRKLIGNFYLNVEKFLNTREHEVSIRQKRIDRYLDVCFIIFAHIFTIPSLIHANKNYIYQLLAESFALKNAEAFARSYGRAIQCLHAQAKKAIEISHQDLDKQRLDDLVDGEVNNRQMEFVTTLIRTPFTDSAIKIAMMNLARKTVEEFFTLEHKDMKRFLCLLDAYVFMDFTDKQTGLYNNHHIFLQQTIGRAIRTGKLDSCPKLLFQYGCMACCDLSSKEKLMSSSDLPVYFEELIQRLLRRDCPQSIVTALNFIQENLPGFMLDHPELLVKLYNSFFTRSGEVLIFHEGVTVLEMICRGLFREYQLVENPFTKLEKTQEWQKAVVEICKKVFIHLLVHNSQIAKPISGKGGHFENICNFLSKAYFNHCFVGEESDYVALIFLLYDKAKDFFGSQMEKFIPIWQKIAMLLLLENKLAPLKPAEKLLRINYLGMIVLLWLKIKYGEISDKAATILEMALKKQFYESDANGFLVMKRRLEKFREKQAQLKETFDSKK